MNNYSISFIFTEDLSKVLLIKKNRTTFIGRYNGPGGEIEPHECPRNAALRELEEESGLHNVRNFSWVATLSVPFDCKVHDGSQTTTLYVYCGTVDSAVDAVQTTDEELCWFPVRDILDAKVSDQRFAGDGDLLFFVNSSLKLLGTDREHTVG